MILGAISGWLNVWLTPLWLLGLGAAAGVAVFLVLWALLFIVSRDGAKAVPTIISEGPLQPVAWIVFGFVAFAILGSFIIRDRGEIYASVARLQSTGTTTQSITLAAAIEGKRRNRKRSRLRFGEKS